MKKPRPATREGYRLDQLLNHPFFISAPWTEPAEPKTISRLHAGLGWWQAFAADIQSDYGAQQAGHDPTPYLWHSDNAYAGRVRVWTLCYLQELAWRSDSYHRACAWKVKEGTADEAAEAKVKGRPSSPNSQKPPWSDSPTGWPGVVTCDTHAAEFYAARYRRHRERARDVALPVA